MSSKLNSAECPVFLYRDQLPAWHKWSEATEAVGFLLLANTAPLSAAVCSIDLATTQEQARPLLVGLTLE